MKFLSIAKLSAVSFNLRHFLIYHIYLNFDAKPLKIENTFLLLSFLPFIHLKHDFLNFVYFWDCLQFWASQVVLRDACGNTLL